MWSKRDSIIFLAGAAAFHTLSHLLLSFSLPITIFSITVTPLLNTIAIIVSALITIGLVWWANRLQ